MWLILDVGNTAVKGGLFEGGELKRTFRLATEPAASVPAYRHTLHEYLHDVPVERAGLVSVVPELTPKLIEAVRLEKMVLPEPVHAGWTLPLEMGYRTPDTLGADRLAVAVAAYVRYGRDEEGTPRHVIAVSAGTAVAYEAVHARGAYLGGAIACGPGLARQALDAGTAQLPSVSLDLPRRAVGRTTTQCLQSGIMYGFVDGVAGMVRRLKRRVRGRSVVVATGGWSAFLAEHVPSIDHVEPALVLYGAHALLEMN